MMRFHQRSLLLALSLFIAICFAACGGATTYPSTTDAHAAANTQTNKSVDAQKSQYTNQKQAIANSTQTTTTQTTASTTQNQGQQNAQNINQGTSQNTTNQNSNQTQGSNQPATTLVISTKQVNINGQATTILTTFNGMTLYLRNADPAPNSTCTGACAKTWPPLLSNGTITSTSSINGTLAIQMTGNGNQVIYNGHPLYTYTGDTAAGQINGQGATSGWNAATVQLQRQHW